MNIYSKNGEKVIFVYPNAGHKHDQEKTKKYLELNKEYTIERTEVGGMHTDVFLKEFPDISFNLVHFKDDHIENIQFGEVEIIPKIDYLKECAAEKGFIIESGENKAFVLKMITVIEEENELKAVEKALQYIDENF